MISSRRELQEKSEILSTTAPNLLSLKQPSICVRAGGSKRRGRVQGRRRSGSAVVQKLRKESVSSELL